MSKTKIEWADRVWNPVTGCTKVSPGCQNCYAERMSHRLKAMGQERYKDGFKVAWHYPALDEPEKWKKLSKVFVCSMGDVFHESVPFEFLDEVMSVIAFNSQHTFLLLTKRPERMKQYFEQLNFIRQPISNLWLGVTAENQEQADKRIPILLQIPAVKRFVSVEPMLSYINISRYVSGDGEVCKCPNCGALDNSNRQFRWVADADGNPTIEAMRCPHCGCDTHCYEQDHLYFYDDFIEVPGLDWVICGGESGSGARPMHPDWVRSLRNQCKDANVPFMFKQWGEWLPDDQGDPSEIKTGVIVGDKSSLGRTTMITGDICYRVGKKKAGRLLDGVLWDQYPGGA